MKPDSIINVGDNEKKKHHPMSEAVFVLLEGLERELNDVQTNTNRGAQHFGVIYVSQYINQYNGNEWLMEVNSVPENRSRAARSEQLLSPGGISLPFV